MQGFRDYSCTSCVCASSWTSQPSVAIPLILSCACLSSALPEHILLGILRHFFCLYGCGGHYCIPSLRRCQKSIIALFAHLGRKFRSVWNLTTYSMNLEKDMQPSSPFWFKISDSKLKCSLISIRNRECEYVCSHVCGRQRATSGVIYDRVFVFARHILYRRDSFSNYEVRRLKFPWFIQSPLTGTIPQSILFPISRQ